MRGGGTRNEGGEACVVEVSIKFTEGSNSVEFGGRIMLSWGPN